MKSFWFVFAVFVAVTLLVGVSRWMAPKEIVVWRTDFAAAQKESAETGNPLLLYFTASWCAPCQQMKRTTWADANVEQALRKYVPAKIDIERNVEIAERFAPQSIPAFLILDRDGSPRKAMEGYMSPEDFLSWLQS